MTPKVELPGTCRRSSGVAIIPPPDAQGQRPQGQPAASRRLLRPRASATTTPLPPADVATPLVPAIPPTSRPAGATAPASAASSVSAAVSTPRLHFAASAAQSVQPSVPSTVGLRAAAGGSRRRPAGGADVQPSPWPTRRSRRADSRHRSSPSRYGRPDGCISKARHPSERAVLDRQDDAFVGRASVSCSATPARRRDDVNSPSTQQ